jgi:precorrin-2/cobalt-factor-2 C20-methyltransferase
VGPGDPELITLKALRLLKAAPVIAYPAPERGQSFARSIVAPHLPGGQEEIVIRMPLEAGAFPQDEIYDWAADVILEQVRGDRDVAVLCEGDPFFYGSFMYLYARLVLRCPVRVVPGVSSLMACAGVSGVPLAARNDTLTVIPATLPEPEIRRRLAATDAAAFIKVGRHLGRLRRLLDELGLLDRARYAERATLTTQRVMPLGDFTDEIGPYFSMVLVHARGEAWR